MKHSFRKKVRPRPNVGPTISGEELLEYLSDWKDHKQIAAHFGISRFAAHNQTGKLLKKGLVDLNVIHDNTVGRPPGLYRRKQND